MEFTDHPVLKLHNAAIYQSEAAVLKNVSFEIKKGEFLYLVGRTGSGKSSLLKTIYADLPFVEGTAEVAGFDLEKITPRHIPFLRRKLGIIFQDFQLFFDRTVEENLLFVMKATGWRDRSKMKKRLSEVLMRVGMGASEKKLPYRLSGGEQQRVTIARALLNEPALMLADEPTGNLDPEVATGILELFRQINNSGTAVLMATHNHQFLQTHPARTLKCAEGIISEVNPRTLVTL